MMKICFKCNIEKDLNSFYKHKRMKDGHLNKCIECTKIDVRTRAEKPDVMEKTRQWAREWIKRPEIKEKRRVYLNNYRRTEWFNDHIKPFMGSNSPDKISEKQIKYRENNKIKVIAHGIVNYSIKNGLMINPRKCENCGSTENIQGHHDDYSKPYDVRWLCHICHCEWHRLNGEGAY